MSASATRRYRPETRLVHAGQLRSNFGETSEALYLTQGFVYESAAQCAARFKGEEPGFLYSRFSNPTVAMFEGRMAAFEGAEAARADYRGDPEILDKTWLTDSHGIALDRDRLTEKLGVSDVYAALSLKPFCSAKQGIAAIEAFRAILDRGVRAETISKVRVRVPPAYAGMIATRAEPGARQSTMVSVAHQIALTALAADRLYDVDRSSAKVDADVAGFAAKVEIIADVRLDAYYPQHWPAEVDVEAGGEVHQQRIVEAIGDPEHPLDHAGIVTKAHRVLDPLLGNDRAAEWLEMAWAAIDHATACRKLAAVFAKGF